MLGYADAGATLARCRRCHDIDADFELTFSRRAIDCFDFF